MVQLANTIDTWLGMKLDWGLWKKWVVATTAGLTVGAAIGASLTIPSPLLIGLAAGLGMGVAQWTVLRAQFGWLFASPLKADEKRQPKGRWILFSTLSVGIVFAVNAGGIMPGVIVGVAQWLVLSRHHKNAWWWIIASVVGWSAGQLISFGLLLEFGLFFGVGLWGLLTGLGAGASTGIVLAWFDASRDDVVSVLTEAAPVEAMISAGASVPMVSGDSPRETGG